MVQFWIEQEQEAFGLPICQVGEGITDVDRSIVRSTSAQTGKDVATMRFEDNTQASNFFARLGLLKIRKRRRFDSVVDQLQSPQKLGISLETVAAKIRPWSLWR